MIAEFGLENPRPIMCTTPDTGAPYYMLQSGNTFYLWNAIGGTVWEIVKPRELDEIVKTMVEKGERALKLKERKEE